MKVFSCLAIILLLIGTRVNADKSVQLGSGKSILVLAAGQVRFAGATQKALMLKYQTAIPITNVTALRQEADEIWELFEVDSNQGGYVTAIISANEAPSGSYISTNASYNFVYVKKNGYWHTIPDSTLTKLDKPSIEAFMNKMDYLYNNNECSSFLVYVSDDWTSTVSDSTSTKPAQVLNPGQFNEIEHDVAAATTGYNHIRRLLNIHISDDGTHAIVESREQEKGIYQGTPFTILDHSLDTLALRDGQIIELSTVTTYHNVKPS